MHRIWGFSVFFFNVGVAYNEHTIHTLQCTTHMNINQDTEKFQILEGLSKTTNKYLGLVLPVIKLIATFIKVIATIF